MAKHATVPSTQPTERIVVDEITLDGRKVAVRSDEIRLELLRLDPQNPRIANSIAFRSQQGDLQRQLEELLWSDPEVHDLYRQVLVNGGLVERVIVKPDHTVVEGNCRVVVYRKLRENNASETRWNAIPARVLPDDISEREIALLLAQLHVQGKNKWSPFEKAGHVYRLHKEFVLTQEEIAVRLRMSKSRVNQLIRSFEAMLNVYLSQYTDPSGVRKYSYFEELFKKPELRDWATNSAANLNRFARWVGEGKLSQGAQVRNLSAILASPEAMAALELGGYQEARKVLEDDDPTLSSPLFKKMAEMTEMLEQARLQDINLAGPDGSPGAGAILTKLHHALSRFIALAGVDEDDK